jgi:hypothetical protein
MKDFKLYPRQVELINLFHKERFTICRAARQVGKSESAAAYMLWYAIFNEDKFIAILANKEKTAKEILGKAKIAFQNLPFWLQQGVASWNHTEITLENGSRIMASSTSSDAIRGYTINFLFLDEFAHVENNQAEPFFQAVFPTIMSGIDSKIVIVSTPKGYNLFWKIWDDATKPDPKRPGKMKNDFKPFYFSYQDVPGRDQAWVDKMWTTLGPLGFAQEVKCDFLGSSATLISGDSLSRMTADEPLSRTSEGLDIYKQPEPGHSYVLVADTSRGQHADYSAFIVFDVTAMPYTIAAKYRRNDVSTLFYPTIIYDVAKRYNEAYCLIEINDSGQQVADILVVDMGYDNLFYTSKSRSPANQPEFVGNPVKISFPGIRTTKAVKRIGCNTLKSLIELNHLLINDYELIFEFSTFVMQGKEAVYAAEEGKNDDLVMCCVLFGWLSTQNFFKDITNSDLRQKILENMRQEREAMILSIVVHNMDDTDRNFDGSRGSKSIERVGNDLWFSGKSMDEVYDQLGIPKSSKF